MSFILKKNRDHFFPAFFFLLLFLIIAGYKITFLHYPILPKPIENVWTWELKIQFHNQKEKNLIQHFLPKTEVGQNIIREDFVSPRFYFFIGKSDGNLSIQWRGKGTEGENRLFYRVTVQTSPRKFMIDNDKLEPKSYPPSIARYLALKEEPESVTLEMRQFLQSLIGEEKSKVIIVKKIFNFITQEIKTVSFAKDQNLIAPIRTRTATLTQKKKLFIHLARLAGIPCRSVHGAFLDEGIRHKSLYSWIEVFLSGKWIPIDLEKYLFGELPENLLILYRGNYSFINSPTVDRLEYSYSALKENQVTFSHFYGTAPLIGSKLHEWSLFSLPLENQQVFRVILMIPFGALIVSIFRNIIGINTFGTFMPVLIALAFRDTKLTWGLLLFSMVIFLGFLSRWYMDRLKLLLVPRLAVIVTVIIIILTIGSVIGAHFGIYRIMAVALFPMVIMTMTIERLSIILMERGLREAIIISMGTFLVASCSYLAISQVMIQNFFFAYPEVLFALIGLQILIGRYTGYRLTEYLRFLNFIKDSGKV